MYKALVLFRDTQDNNHIYHEGDTYPRDGYTPTEERIKELLGCENRRGLPVIEEPLPFTEQEPVEQEEPVTEQAPVRRGRRKKSE